MLTGWKAKREASRVRALMLGLAQAVVPQDSLSLSIVCDPRDGQGLLRGKAFFLLVASNVTPVVLNITRVALSLEGWSGNVVLSSSEDYHAEVWELHPGASVSVPFDLPVKVVPGNQFDRGRAVHIEAKCKLTIEGPVHALCTTITKTVCCWMPCREAIIS